MPLYRLARSPLMLHLLLSVAVGVEWTKVDNWNAVPTGVATTVHSFTACEALCVNESKCVLPAATLACTPQAAAAHSRSNAHRVVAGGQLSWNHLSHHCYLSTSSIWAGKPSDHITSGCRIDRVPSCGPPPQPPPPPTYDGVLRDVGGGRVDAYMPPPFESNHASMVEQTASGRLHMAWFSGSHEGQDGVAIVHSWLSTTGSAVGSVWSNATTLSERKGYSNQNAVVFSDDNASLLHIFHSQQGAGKGESAATVWHLQSPLDAAGRATNFSKPHCVLDKPGSFDKNRVVPLLDGSWLLPIYEQGRNPNYPTNAFKATGRDPDDTASWSLGSYAGGCDSLVQPSVIRRQPGKPHLQAFFRDRRAEKIYTATSDDDGTTWTRCTATSLPNNNAGIHAFQMRSGRIALVYNPQTHFRDPLAISLSEDGGATWKYTRVLERQDGRQEFSYPTIREDKVEDGVIHVSYTYKRETIKYSRITEAWIMQ